MKKSNAHHVVNDLTTEDKLGSSVAVFLLNDEVGTMFIRFAISEIKA